MELEMFWALSLVDFQAQSVWPDALYSKALAENLS